MKCVSVIVSIFFLLFSRSSDYFSSSKSPHKLWGLEIGSTDKEFFEKAKEDYGITFHDQTDFIFGAYISQDLNGFEWMGVPVSEIRLFAKEGPDSQTVIYLVDFFYGEINAHSKEGGEFQDFADILNTLFQELCKEYGDPDNMNLVLIPSYSNLQEEVNVPIKNFNEEITGEALSTLTLQNETCMFFSDFQNVVLYGTSFKKKSGALLMCSVMYDTGDGSVD